MRHLRIVLSVLVVLPLLFAGSALSAVYARIDGIPGGAMAKDHMNDIELLSVNFAGQVILDQTPWHPTLPPGMQSFTITKKPDKASAGLSAAFASKRELHVQILVDSNPTGGSPAHSLGPAYDFARWTISSFTSTGVVETVVFAPAGRSLHGVRTPTPAPEKQRR